MHRNTSGIPVLTYHANNVNDNSYAGNDHVALAEDLRVLHESGWRAIHLDGVLAWHAGQLELQGNQRCYAVTFDDGSDFDFHDIQHPTWGVQRSLVNVLRDHLVATGEQVQAASFVIASASARQQLDQHCLIGQGWWNDDWWSDANASGHMSIESHGWDHLHPVLDKVAQLDGIAGDFRRIEHFDDCDQQLHRSAQTIAQISGRRPKYFAFPWGQYSDYLSGQYLPEQRDRHGYCAAFSTAGRAVRRNDNRWCLPRFVCGEHWDSARSLLKLVQASGQLQPG